VDDGFHGVTDSGGQVALTLPAGSYRFRSDVHGHPYWSATEDACAVPECGAAGVTVPVFGQVTVTVQYGDGERLADLPVYAFTGSTYSGISGVSDAAGQVTLWLPEGNYHFRTDFLGLQFWSGEEDHCTVTGCDAVTLVPYAYGFDPNEGQTITYTYDSLNCLTAADYDTGAYFHYVYDAAVNRLSEAQKSGADAAEEVNSYSYDIANRLVEVNGVAYTSPLRVRQGRWMPAGTCSRTASTPIPTTRRTG
jgi:hypothetical protein